MVGKTGLEPARLATLASKTSTSTIPPLARAAMDVNIVPETRWPAQSCSFILTGREYGIASVGCASHFQSGIVNALDR
jgi:hypothetical protein